MKLNRIFLSALASLTLLVTSCEKDYQAPNDLSDFGWQISTDENNTDPIFERTGVCVSLLDISQGTTSHVWEISYDSGVRYLRNEVIPDSDKDLSDNIDLSLQSQNNADAIHIVFTETGKQTVKLRNTYQHPVTYTYSYREEGISERKYKTIESEYINGEYVMEQVFNFEIFNNTIEPVVKVYLDAAYTQEVKTGYKEDGTGYEDVEIRYGDTLYFVDETGDRTNAWGWSCVAAGFTNEVITSLAYPYATSSVGLMFNKLTTANNNIPFNVIEELGREKDTNNPEMPLASTKMVVPLNITVVSSTDALKYSVNQVGADMTLEMVLDNYEFDPSSLNNIASKFSLKVDNDDANYHQSGLEPTSVELKYGFNNILVLTFAETLYNSDSMVLTCNDTTGSIKLFDGKTLNVHLGLDGETSKEITVDTHLTNGGELLLSEYFDFTTSRDDLAGKTPADLGWKLTTSGGVENPASNNTVEFVEDPDDSSKMVLMVNFVDKEATYLLNENMFDAPAGDYTYAFDFYTETAHTNSINVYVTSDTSTNDLAFSSTPTQPNNGGGFYMIGNENKVIYENVWRTLSKAIVGSSGGTNRRVSIYAANPLGSPFYLRKVSLSNAKLRPAVVN